LANRLSAARRAHAHAPGGVGGDPLLGLDRAFGGAAGPFAQALYLTRLCDVEHDHQSEPQDRGEARERTDCLDAVRYRQREMECHIH
jgi:hypothetical protein